MRTAYVDIKWGVTAGPTEKEPNAGWISYSGPRDYPSPALLGLAAGAAEAGEDVSWHYLSTEQAARDGAGLLLHLGSPGRVVVSSPGPHRARADALGAALREAGAETFAADPWAAPPPEGPSFGYDRTRGAATGHAEVDVLPYRDPVHPWVCPPVASSSTAAWEARLRAAVESFAPADPAERERPIWQAHERDLVLNDSRIPTTMDRLRAVAQLVSAGLEEHSTMLKLHLHLWPRDALAELLADHMTLLPIGSVDLLAGTLVPGAAGCREGATDVATIEAAMQRLAEAGMGHLVGLSIVLGLPGETAEGCIESVNRAVEAATARGFPRVRFAFWLGEGAPPPWDPAAERRLFLASHPDWHPLEYAGIHDFVAVVRSSLPQLQIVGPGFAHGWEPPA